MGEATTIAPLHRNRDFNILWAGDTVSGIGSAMSALVFPLIGYAITGSTVRAGLATTAVFVGAIIARLPAGAITDRLSRSRVLLVSNVLAALAFGSLAVAAALDALTLAHLIAVGLITGATDAFIGPAASASVRTVVPQEQLPIAYTRLQARQHAADLVGPPLGGVLFSLARALPFVVDAISYAIYAAATTLLRTPLPAPDGPRRTLRKDVVEGLRFVWQHTVIRSIMLWAGIANFAWAYVFVTITLRLIRAGVHPAAIGLVDTIGAAAGLLGAALAPALVRRMPSGLLTIVTGLVFAVLVVPMAATTNVFVIGTLFALVTLLLPANNSGISAYLSTATPDRLQARMHSAAGFIANGLSPLAPALAGIFIGTLGGSTAVLIGAAVSAASLVPLLVTREVRTLGRPATWQTTNT
ncbi:MAG TPA: MFS transporter [Jatrophihabitantaceae bacterium]